MSVASSFDSMFGSLQRRKRWDTCVFGGNEGWRSFGCWKKRARGKGGKHAFVGELEGEEETYGMYECIFSSEYRDELKGM